MRTVVRNHRARRQKRAVLRDKPPSRIDRADWPESLRDPTGFYLKCVRGFGTLLPEDVRRHREYFARDHRGFGEDAFHVMWFLLFQEFKPKTFLEIGVYRGQTLSLAALLQRQFNCKGEIAGISPFSPAGDSVSQYLSGLDYLEDTKKNFRHFALPAPNLIKAFSTEPAAQSTIASRQWDCVYIDGNHDYEVARKDWDCCSRNLSHGGLVVLDDSGLTTSYQAPLFATAGHPGPSELAKQIKDSSAFSEILQVGHNRAFQRSA
jgi:Methyltransferase domain